MNSELVLVLDFGGQYNQLIARRVRECNVYAEVIPYTTKLEDIIARKPKGIIFTGGPNSVYEEESPSYDKAIMEAGIPILGICYGSQLMAHKLGGQVLTAPVSEYGKTEVEVDVNSKLFEGVSPKTITWMSHTDYIAKAPEGFKVIGHTPNCPVAAMEDEAKKLYAVQFHPEVMHSVEGQKMIRNFLYNVCECSGDWKMDSFVETTIAQIREKVGDGKVLLALSGGVDSSVAAGLLARAIGKQLTCVFVDHGLLRKNEGDEVEAVFGPNGNFDLNFIRVNAQERYYSKLAGVTEPEAKRKIIGEEFIRVFEEEAKKIGAVDFLAQGTIYPDVIESGLGKSAVIKSHHNVGGLPDFVDFKEIIEPLRMLFKDEVRKAGLELGLPENLVFRQPFPGPGLGIRIIGEVTAEKVKIVQDADYIYREELAKAGIDKNLGQYFAALTNMRSVGVMGDGRTYDYAIALRAVMTSDFMTADCAQIPWDVLTKVANRIVNEVKGVNRVMYDCTSKPPATIEFE
ncbi:glutamine-hydrolyzing GMP synthase [Lachnospira sp.]|uniref:glutamine-hydrolyzing GMP synthase n=1 Tax=Lachnospira sp. TaxID=2049031 RepID=UPI00257B57C0|nr:glutamine-hydrolyzing GMP synthase [Lachnospira sp.]